MKQSFFLFFGLLLRKWLKRHFFFPAHRASVEAAAPAVYLCAQGQTPGWVIWPCGRCYRQRRRKMVSVWAVTVCIPRGEPQREGKLHLPRSCALTKFCQSHSRWGEFTSESTSAPGGGKKKRKIERKHHSLSSPFRYKSAFSPARHATFPTLSIKVICILTHFLISPLLKTNAAFFFSHPSPAIRRWQCNLLYKATGYSCLRLR